MVVKTAKKKIKTIRTNTRDVPRPFLKWIGGKGQLVDELLAMAPKRFKAYHEPFVGGGALFFALQRAERLNGKEVHLSDINGELVATYEAIREEVHSVIRHLGKHQYDDGYHSSVFSPPLQRLPISPQCFIAPVGVYGFSGAYHGHRTNRGSVAALDF